MHPCANQKVDEVRKLADVDVSFSKARIPVAIPQTYIPAAMDMPARKLYSAANTSLKPCAGVLRIEPSAS
jgi:hypothetical protein